MPQGLGGGAGLPGQGHGCSKEGAHAPCADFAAREGQADLSRVLCQIQEDLKENARERAREKERQNERETAWEREKEREEEREREREATMRRLVDQLERQRQELQQFVATQGQVLRHGHAATPLSEGRYTPKGDNGGPAHAPRSGGAGGSVAAERVAVSGGYAGGRPNSACSEGLAGGSGSRVIGSREPQLGSQVGIRSEMHLSQESSVAGNQSRHAPALHLTFVRPPPISASLRLPSYRLPPSPSLCRSH